MIDPQHAAAVVHRVREQLDAGNRHRDRPVPLRPDAEPVRVPLPLARALPPRTVQQVLAERRSSYAFGAGQPTRQELADLLRWSLGAQRHVTAGGRRHRAGTAPSAGGLPSLDPWLVVRGAGGLVPGVHRGAVRAADEATAGTLTRTHTGDPTTYLSSALDQPQFATRATVFVVLVARLDVTLPVYGPRHFRTLHLDAGTALQNLSLVATSLGLPGCAISGFDDEAVGRLLGLNGTAFPAVVFACGSRVRTAP